MLKKLITIDAAHDAKLKARVEAARRAGQRTSYSGEIRRCVDEAEGNAQRLRHAIRGDLHVISGNVQLLRTAFHASREREALDAIARAAANITAAVAPPAA